LVSSFCRRFHFSREVLGSRVSALQPHKGFGGPHRSPIFEIFPARLELSAVASHFFHSDFFARVL
jgi:hypothetical protein